MYITHTPKRITLKGYKTDDCTIIAIGNALGLSYDLARKVLQVGSYRNRVFSFRKRNPMTKDEFIRQNHIEMICRALSVRSERFEINNRKKRTTLEEFAKENKKGVYIVLVDRHLVSVMNGKIVDTWNSTKRKVISAYEIDTERAHKMIYDLAVFYRMTSNEHFVKGHKRNIIAQAAFERTAV